MDNILIKNAKLRNNKNNLVDILIENGIIKEISSNISKKEDLEIIEANGNLVTESFCNPHLHLCKVYTLTMMSEEALTSYHGEDMGEAMTAIELASKIKEKYDHKWIIENVKKALKKALKYGNTHIRAFADVDSKAKLEGIKALLEAKELFKDKLTLQVVAFPQDGVIREPGTVELIEEAMKLGADVVGGIPWIEYTEKDELKHIELMFEIAKKYNSDISMLVDDAGDPTLKTLEMLALKSLEEKWENRCIAHHARAMALYPMPYFKKLCAILKKSGTSIVSDPHTGPLHARVKELLENGVNVSLGQDDIVDAYYPYGRNNMLEVGFLASHILWMTTFKDMEKIYDMITLNPAKAMNIKNFGIKVGNIANIVVLNAKSIHEALMYHEPPLFVISNGNLIK